MASPHWPGQNWPGQNWPNEPVRVGLMFAAMYWITGVSTPFLPVWLESRGISLGEIGALLIVPQVIRLFVSPAVGFAADRYRAPRTVVIAGSILGLAAWIWLSRSMGFAAAMVALVLIAISNTTWPLVESIALASARARGHDYGRMRLGGTIAFVAASLFGGWVIARHGNGSAIWLLVAGAMACVIAAVMLPASAASDVPVSSRRLSWSDARDLLAVPQMRLLLLASGAVQGAHGMYYTYGTLHWQALGLDPKWYGTLWAIGLLPEIALFWWSGRAHAALGAVGLFLLGAGLSVIRWTAMGFDPPLLLLIPLQLLHGLTFGASHLGTMHLLATIAPPDRAGTAQALYSVVSTVGIILATAVASRAYPLLGGRLYYVMALMALAGWLAMEVLRRRQTRTA